MEWKRKEKKLLQYNGAFHDIIWTYVIDLPFHNFKLFVSPRSSVGRASDF